MRIQGVRIAGNLAFISKDIIMRTLFGGGYSEHQYSTAALRDKAQLVAAAIPRLLKKFDADCIVVTGKSGHSVAFAALMLVDYPLCVVRKESDQSHGSSIEGAHGVEVRRYLILDDFIASGATVSKCIHTMDGGFEDMHCVGVVEYSQCGESSPSFWVERYAEDIPVIRLMQGE